MLLLLNNDSERIYCTGDSKTIVGMIGHTGERREHISERTNLLDSIWKTLKKESKIMVFDGKKKFAEIRLECRMENSKKEKNNNNARNFYLS
jgi:hypothetical protein